MTHIIRSRSSIRAQVEVVGRQTKRAISLVGVLHYQIVNVPEEPVIRKPRRPDSNHQTVARLIRRRLDIRDVARRRIWTTKTRHRRVEVPTVQQMYATLVLVIRRQSKQLERVRLDTERRLNDVRDL